MVLFFSHPNLQWRTGPTAPSAGGEPGEIKRSPNRHLADFSEHLKMISHVGTLAWFEFCTRYNQDSRSDQEEPQSTSGWLTETASKGEWYHMLLLLETWRELCTRKDFQECRNIDINITDRVVSAHCEMAAWLIVQIERGNYQLFSKSCNLPFRHAL